MGAGVGGGGVGPVVAGGVGTTGTGVGGGVITWLPPQHCPFELHQAS